MSRHEGLRALIPREARHLLTRRAMIGRSLAATLGLSHVACGGDEGPPEERNLAIYSWAEYHAPENIRSFATRQHIGVTFDFFDSNEAMLAKLELAGASSGYDVVVPNIEFVPLLVSKGLIRPLDRARIPNWSNQDPAILALKDGPGGDPGGQYAAVKDWGTTGYVYDRKAVTGQPTSWADFSTIAARPGVSGRVSILPSPFEVLGLALWRDASTARDFGPDSLARAEQVLLAAIAPHVKAFDGYPVLGLLGGDYSLAQCWSGDARKVIVEDPDRFVWVRGAPVSNMWIATWVVTTSCASPNAAHALIDYMLDPEVSAREIAFIGNDTGVVGVEKLLPADLPARDMIFMSPAERQALVPSILSDAQPRLVDIFNKVKLAASRA